MKVFKFFLGVILSFSLMSIVLITSVEIAAYSDYSFYEKEYSKYAVTVFTGVPMPELMNITKDMMAYLKDEKQSLSDIRATVRSIPNTPFFNEKEATHMKDVKGIFISAILLRRLLVAVSIICIILIRLFKGRLHRFISNVLIFGTLTTLSVTCSIAFIIASDFEKYFIAFHHIFFDNNLWMLNPTTDNLINLVPEGFFVDMSERILTIFLSFIAVMIGIGIVLKFFQKKLIHYIYSGIGNMILR